MKWNIIKDGTIIKNWSTPIEIKQKLIKKNYENCRKNW